jgi:prepilin-type N-terminal cleavage/methylation domain-containing protein
MKKSFNQKGFTLIELLVVVAIIGILAATILASLGSARSRARISRAQSEMSSMRAAAELVYSSQQSYEDVFVDTDSGMANLVASVDNIANSINEQIASNNQAWAFSAEFGTGTISTFCVDSNGYAGPGSANSNGSCNPPSLQQQQIPQIQ